MPRQIKKYDHRDELGRELFLISVDNVSEILPLPARENAGFAILLAMDGRKEIIGDFGDIPRELIENDLAYVCAWGPDCERVHDIFDEEIVMLQIDDGKELKIMTTWHTHDSLENVLWYALHSIEPMREYSNPCTTLYVVSVGNPEWASRFDAGLSDIDEFDTKILENDSPE